MADGVKRTKNVSARGLPASAFVTGATGFIGHRLITALLEAGCEVSALVLPAERGRLPGSVRTFAGDITDADAVAGALTAARPALVFHLAAIGITNPGLPMAEACRINVGGLINLIDGVRAIDTVTRVVIAGTSYEYGARRSDDGLDPFNPYSASKAAAWAFARAAYNAWGMPGVCVRPFQVYGPGQRARALIPAAATAALRGEDFRMTKGEQQRDFVFVEDVVQGFIAAGAAADIEGRVLDLGTGELHAVKDVVARIWDIAEAPGRIIAGALPYRAGEVPAIPADVQRTRLLTGWEAATDLDRGLSLTIEALGEEIVNVN
ncbi:MAG: NAD-dependent epimerase/dehydratase family protein [Anaerolineae bacterium]